MPPSWKMAGITFWSIVYIEQTVLTNMFLYAFSFGFNVINILMAFGLIEIDSIIIKFALLCLEIWSHHPKWAEIQGGGVATD